MGEEAVRKKEGKQFSYTGSGPVFLPVAAQFSSYAEILSFRPLVVDPFFPQSRVSNKFSP